MKEPMQIAMIGAEATPGGRGVDGHVAELASRMVQAGHAVTVYGKPSIFGSDRLFNGILMKSTPPFVARLYAVIHACLALRADVIHFHGATSAARYAWLPHVLRPQAKVVTTFHARSGHVAERTAIDYSHELITTDRDVAQSVFTRHGARLRYVPSGVHVRRVATNDIVLEPFGLRSMNYAVCFAESDEDMTTLLDAWNALRVRSARFAHYRLAVVGKTGKSQDRSVVYVGTQTGEVRHALYAGAAFVVVAEGASMDVALEAMSYGRAVLAPAAHAFASCIDGLAGQYTSGDAEMLTTFIAEILEDPMFAASVGHMAREFVEMEFSWARAAAEVLECYTGGYEEAIDAGAVQRLLQ